MESQTLITQSIRDRFGPLIPIKTPELHPEGGFEFEGRRYPSVTRCIRQAGLDDLSLVIYRPQLAEVAKRRGQRVHRVTEMADRERAEGAMPASRIEAFIALARGADDPEDYSQFVIAWERFVYDLRPVFVAIELPVVSVTFGYAGILDRLVIIDGELWILDLKTGGMGMVRPAAVTALQTAAYSQATVESLAMKAKARRGAVLLRADGDYRLVEYWARDFSADFETFMSAVVNVRWRMNRGKQNEDDIDTQSLYIAWGER